MVAHAFNPSTREAEAGRFLSSGLQSEFQDSQGYTEKSYLKKNQNKKKKKRERETAAGDAAQG
jgi:hypothetical protein